LDITEYELVGCCSTSYRVSEGTKLLRFTVA